MFFTATQPDGSVENIGPKEIGLAKIWGSFNKDLNFLLRLLKNCNVGDTFKYQNRLFERVK